MAVSAPGEERWGYHQFPTISRLPDGNLIVTYNEVPDRTECYGVPGPARISRDGGVTWEKWNAPEPLLTISHSVISPVNEGEHLCVPMSPSLDLDKAGVSLPQPVASADIYGRVDFYRPDPCPLPVREFLGRLPALRWTPARGRWQREEVRWDIAQAVLRRRGNGPIARPHIDNRILNLEGVLYYADYHLPHLLPDGSAPKNYACWCMTSRDNGRSWQRAGLIAYDPAGETMMGEPCLAPTSDGRFVCVIRCTHHEQKPMLLTQSADRGKTWSPPRPLHPFGVMPQLLLLANGVLVLSFGRPGVHLRFSGDGTARDWSEPLSLIPTDPEGNLTRYSCGYTRLLATGDDRFLIVYSDFQYPTGDGRTCKAILVRQVRVAREP